MGSLDTSTAKAAAASNSIAAIHEDSSMVQIPASELASMMATIQGLRDDVSSLQNKLSNFDTSQQSNTKLQESDDSTGNELVHLKQNSSPRFPQFGRLPAEIRCMIWGYAFLEPQFLVLCDHVCSRSRINDIVDSCLDAKEAARVHKLDYFTIHVNPQDHPNWTALQLSSYKNYVNLHLDTVWLPYSAKIPRPIQMHCGFCRANFQPNISKSGSSCVETCSKYGELNKYGDLLIEKMALSWDTFWISKEFDYAIEKCPVWSLVAYSVKELVLVVGDTAPFPNEGVELTEPSSASLHKIIYPNKYESTSELEYASNRVDVVDYNKSHGDDHLNNPMNLEDSALDITTGIRKQFQAFKDRHIQWGRKLPPDETDKWLGNLSKWEVPSIKLMEAKVTSKRWTLY